MSFIAEIETRVAGIPCVIGVVEYFSVAGSYSQNAASDWDVMRNGQCIGHYLRLKDAKKFLQTVLSK